MVHYINLHPQLTEWTGSNTVDANGTISAVLMENGVPVWHVDNEVVRAPNAIVQDINRGSIDVDHKFQLPATTGAQYWKFTIQLGELKRTWFFTWPNSATTDFADLNFINPRAYEGV